MNLTLNSLLNDNFLDWTKFRSSADDKLNVAKIMISVLHRVENIVGKGENAGYQHFLLFPQCFQKASLLGLLKVGTVWKRVNPFPNNPWFLCTCSSSLLKTLWEKEKLLITHAQHFLFVPTVFTTLSAISIKFKIVACKVFHFVRVRICRLGKG